VTNPPSLLSLLLLLFLRRIEVASSSHLVRRIYVVRKPYTGRTRERKRKWEKNGSRRDNIEGERERGGEGREREKENRKNLLHTYAHLHPTIRFSYFRPGWPWSTRHCIKFSPVNRENDPQQDNIAFGYLNYFLNTKFRGPSIQMSIFDALNPASLAITADD